MKNLFILTASAFFMFFAACSILNPYDDYEINNVVPDTAWYWHGEHHKYIINTPEELAGLSLLVKNGRNMKGITIMLGADISFNANNGGKYRWTPIGINTDKPFGGVFDGNGYVVSGIYLYSANDHQGFFGWIEGGAVIKNLGLEDLYIDGSARFVGGLVGTNRRSLIQNCYTAGEVRGNFNYTGGLVGYNDGGRIENSYSKTNVSGKSDVGGLAGANLGYISAIVNSYSVGKVSGDKNVGGLVGHNAGAAIINSYFNNELSQRNDEGNGTGKTTAEMKQQSTFAHWDFTNTWQINNNYPELRIFFDE